MSALVCLRPCDVGTLSPFPINNEGFRKKNKVRVMIKGVVSEKPPTSYTPTPIACRSARPLDPLHGKFARAVETSFASEASLFGRHPFTARASTCPTTSSALKCEPRGAWIARMSKWQLLLAGAGGRAKSAFDRYT